MKLSKILLAIFIMILSFSLNTQANPKFKLIYVVQAGDTLSEIAEDYGVRVEDILQANDLSSHDFIKLGQELIIPLPEEEEKPAWDLKLFNQEDRNFELEVEGTYAIRINPSEQLPEVNIPTDKLITYHVSVGDTLYDLARSFNTSIGVIMALNDLNNSIIRVGDQILLPINNLTPRQVLARTVSEEDLELLARAIHGEARGEPFIGQVAVGAVIINRVLSSYFPNTFAEVIYQKGQFSAVADGQFNLQPNRTAYLAAKEALRGTDPTMGSLYYYNPKTAKNKWWFETRQLTVTIGDHVFAK